MSLRWKLTNYRQHHAWLRDYRLGTDKIVGRVSLTDDGQWAAHTSFKRLEFIGVRVKEETARKLVERAVQEEIYRRAFRFQSRG